MFDIFTKHALAARAGTILIVAGTTMSVAAKSDDQSLMLIEITEGIDPPAASTLPSMDAAVKKARATPGGSDVVPAEEYRQGRAAGVDEVLRFSPGVFAASRFGTEESRLSIRGSGLQRTFHLRGISLLQDGVPMNQADGGGDFQSVEPLSSRYVEVYRGANALQFGVANLGGAVNFVSPSARREPPFRLRLSAGAFDYHRAQVSAAAVRGDLDAYLSVSQYDIDGYRDHSQQDTRRLAGNLGLQVSPDVDVRFFLFATHSRSALPGNLTKAQLRSDPRQARAFNVSGDWRRDFEEVRLSNRTVFDLGPGAGSLELGGFHTWKSLDHPIFQVLEIDYRDYGINARYRSARFGASGRHRFTGGISGTRGTADDNRFANAGGNKGARTGDSHQVSENLALFGEHSFEMLPGWSLVAGGQWHVASRELDDRFFGDATDNSVDETFRRFSPRLGLRRDLPDGTQWYANWSASFEPPTFGELAGGPAVTPVHAQRASTFEIGTRGTSETGSLRTHWDVTAYRAEVRGELLSLTDALGNPLGTVNAERTRHQGLETGFRFDIGDAWRVNLAWQYNDFRFRNDPAFGNNRLAGAPAHFGNAELRWQGDHGLYAGPTVQAASRTWVDHANTLNASGYAVYGFRVGQEQARFRWFIDFRNLADRTYAATTGVTANAGGQDSAQFLPGDGRSLFVGIEFTP